MKLSIQVCLFLIQISSSSATFSKFKATAQRPNICELDESVVQTGTPQRALDDNSNFIKHGFYPSSSNQQPRIGIDSHINPQDSMNSWRTNVQRDYYNNFIASSTRQTSRIIEPIGPKHHMNPSRLSTRPGVRVDKDRSKSRKRIYEPSSDGSEDESSSSSATESDQSESNTEVQQIRNMDSISRKRTKRPALGLEDGFRPSPSIPNPHIIIGVDSNISPPQARDPRRLINDGEARVDMGRDFGIRIGIDHPSLNTQEESIPSFSTRNRQNQGDGNSIPPHSIASERSNTEVVVRGPDITPSVLNIPEDGSMAREVDEKEVLNVLTQAGSTARYLSAGLLQKIEYAFNHIKTSIIARTLPNNLNSYSQEEKEAALKKVQNDVVNGFLGGLFAIFAGHIPQYSDLIDAGWEFLGTYLTQAFFLVPDLCHQKISRGSSLWKDEWAESTNLFGYILELNKDENISPHLILKLLQKWEAKTRYKPGTCDIVINYSKLLDACESLETNRGKSIWKSRPDVQRDITKPSHNAHQNKSGSSQVIQKYPMQSNQNSLEQDIRSTPNTQSYFPSTQNLQRSHMAPNQDTPGNYMPSGHTSLPDYMRYAPGIQHFNWPSTHISSNDMMFNNNALQRSVEKSNTFPQRNTLGPQNIIQHQMPSTSHVQQSPMASNQDIPWNHMEANQHSLQHEWRLTPNMPQHSFPSNQLSPNYMTSNNDIFQHDMRLNHKTQVGDNPSRQNFQHITPNPNFQLDRMAVNYMRSNQDMFHNQETLNEWKTGQIIPQLITRRKEGSLQIKIGRFMTRLGDNYLYHHKQFGKEVKTFFDDLGQKIMCPLVVPEGTKPGYIADLELQRQKILYVISAAEDQIITAFLAAAFLIHQTQGIQHPWGPILKSAWEFMKRYFSKWEPVLEKYCTSLDLRLPQTSQRPSDSSNPESVVRYLANHRKKDNTPISLVWYMLEEWHKTEGISSRFDITTFNIDHIKSFHHHGRPVQVDDVNDGFQKGNKRTQSSSNRISPTMGKDDNTSFHQSERTLEPSIALSAKVNSARLSISPGFAGFVRKIGDSEIQNQGQLSQEYDKIFSDLQEDILSIFSRDHHGIYSVNQEFSPSQGSSDIVKTAISNAKSQLGPAFIGCLRVLYQDHFSQHDQMHILQSSLTIIKKYIDQWQDFLKSNKSPTWFANQGQSILDIEWSNIGDVLSYLGSRQSTDYMPIQPLKHLTKLWYEHYNKGEAGPSSFGFNIQPPNFSLIEESYIAHLLKNKRNGSLDLWNIENVVGGRGIPKKRAYQRHQRKLLMTALREEHIQEDNTVRKDQGIMENGTIRDRRENETIRKDQNTMEDQDARGHRNSGSISSNPTGNANLLGSGLNIGGDRSVTNGMIIARMKTEDKLWKQYSSFFQDFETQVSKLYEGSQETLQDTSLRGRNKLVLDHTGVSNVIKVAKNQITTSFMFILFLAHSGQKANQPLSQIWESGWGHLEKYFETWKDFILSNEVPMTFKGRQKLVNRIDWSNPLETIRYMATHQQQHTGTSQILIHLVKTWYSKVDLQGSTVESSGYQHWPNEKLIQDALSRIKNDYE